jgi:glucoamylase
MNSLGSSWDLWWPPVWGGSYWTASLQYRALRGGARLGRAIGHSNDVAEYDAHATMLLEYMQVSSELEIRRRHARC